MLSVERIELARKRRRYTYKILAERAGVSPVTLSRIINKKQDPDAETVIRIISALNFPKEFFFQDVPEEINVNSASFRSLSSMTARDRDAALSAGVLAFEVVGWLHGNYNLPKPDVIDLSNERNPHEAASRLRRYWGISEKPIGNLIGLLESKGVRVFSLSEDTKSVDAFSTWRLGEPYIFLNTMKTSERSRFDAAHELGHLVLHKHGGPNQKSAEIEANAFAGSFLMPSVDVRSRLSSVRGLSQIIDAKKRWGVSASALSYRLHKMGLMSDWQYRTICIQITKLYGNSEPEEMQRERSSIWDQVLKDLWRQGRTRKEIADGIFVPESELEGIIFGLAATPPERPKPGKADLRIIKS